MQVVARFSPIINDPFLPIWLDDEKSFKESPLSRPELAVKIQLKPEWPTEAFGHLVKGNIQDVPGKEGGPGGEEPLQILACGRPKPFVRVE